MPAREFDRLARAGDEYCHVGRRRRGTWIKLTKVARGTGQERYYHAKVSKVASPAKEARRRRRYAHARAPWRFTAHERPSLGRGEDPSSSDGGRNHLPQQPGRDAPRRGPVSPVRGSRADASTRAALPHP